MRRLTKAQTAIYLAGAVAMALGAGLTLVAWRWAPWLFAAGTLAFAAMQMAQRYDGTDVTIRRLRRIMLLSDFLFMMAALLMIAEQGNPLRLSWVTYLQLVYRKWVVVTLIAAVLQLYSVHRIGNELEREAKKR